MIEQVGSGSVDRTRALYERPVLGVENESTFSQVKFAVESCLSEAGVPDFFRRLDKAGLRIRDFEAVLKGGQLGKDTVGQYASLSPGDQGQIREFYLASLEHVPSSLRDRFFKLYAYY